MKTLMLMMIGAVLLAQVPRPQVPRPKPTVIIPDGLVPGSRTEDHRVDLSSCDEVTYKVKLNYASIENGVLTDYSFKKYGSDIEIICKVVKP